MKRRYTLVQFSLLLLGILSSLNLNAQCELTVIHEQGISCHGDSDGELCFRVAGGTSPYNVEVHLESTLVFDSTLIMPDTICMQSLVAGDYIITVTGFDGCALVGTIESPTSPLMLNKNNTIIEDISCAGSLDGSIDIDPVGGTPPYTYDWSNDGIGDHDDPQDLINLSAGNYQLNLRDNNNCSYTDQFVVGATPSFTLDVDISDVTCPGGDDGAITVIPMDGNGPPFTFNWSIGGGNNGTRNNLTEGSYSVTITDSRACTRAMTYTVEAPPAITLNRSITHVSCPGGNDGAISVNPNGGNGVPYSFEWSTGAGSDTIGNLSAGNYIVTISDAENCTATFDYTVVQPDTFDIKENVTPVACFGESNGSIRLNVGGGTPGYFYEWFDGTNTRRIENLSVGEYTYTVTDDRGCEAFGSATINQPDLLVVNASVIPVTCNSDDDGEASITPEGGTGTATATWNTGADAYTISNLSPGQYSVILKDENNCTATDTVVVEKELDPVIESYEAQATYGEGESTNLSYVANQDFVQFNWRVLNAVNIDTGGSYQGMGTSDEIINTSFQLLSERSTGFLSLEIFPQKGECIGDSVITTLSIFPAQTTLFIPGLFTPNGDGVNDCWEIVFPETSDPSDYFVKVFSRNGKLVYEENSLAEQWKGIDCPDGDYYFLIGATNSNEVIKGAVSILRK